MSIKHRIYKHVYNIDTVLPNIVLTILSFNLSVVIFGKGEVSSFWVEISFVIFDHDHIVLRKVCVCFKNIFFFFWVQLIAHVLEELIWID